MITPLLIVRNGEPLRVPAHLPERRLYAVTTSVVSAGSQVNKTLLLEMTPEEAAAFGDLSEVVMATDVSPRCSLLPASLKPTHKPGTWWLPTDQSGN